MRAMGSSVFPSASRIFATGCIAHRPTLAERVSRQGGTAIAISNVSPGAAYFLDPDGFGWVYNPAGSFGPGRLLLPTPSTIWCRPTGGPCSATPNVAYLTHSRASVGRGAARSG